MSLDFTLLACCTSFDVFGDPFFHSRPIVSLLGGSQGFVSSWVSCRGVVVVQEHEGAFQRFVVGWNRKCVSCFSCIASGWRDEGDVLVIVLAFVGTWRA